MRSLKLAFPAICCPKQQCCNSEWPYEVTETKKDRTEAIVYTEVAIANGRMRSLKQYWARHLSGRGRVAIANGRMRSLKPERRRSRVKDILGCNSEWPYEVTETLISGDNNLPSLRRCNSEWPYEVTETSSARSATVERRCCNSEWPYEVTETELSGRRKPQVAVVAIANGRMRSLKLQRGWRSRGNLSSCDSEWPYEVTETLPALG